MVFTDKKLQIKIILFTICTFIALLSGCSKDKQSGFKKSSDTLQTKNSSVEDSITVKAKGVLFKIPEKLIPYKHIMRNASEAYLTDIKDEILKDFSKKEFNFIKQQSKKSFVYSENNISSKLFLPEKFPLDFFMNTKADEYSKVYNEDGFNYLSAPLFSIDNNYFIISAGYKCGGKCGQEAILIYEKINGSFRLKKILSEIIF